MGRPRKKAVAAGRTDQPSQADPQTSTRSSKKMPSNGAQTATTKRKSARVKKNRWHEDSITTKSNSPLVNVDLVKLLSDPRAWLCLEEEDKKQILALLPESVHPHHEPNPDGTEAPIPALSQDFLRYSNAWRDGIRQVQADLENGKYEPQWQRRANEASRERAEGAFDKWKEDEFEEFWGQKQKVDITTPSGESATVKLKTLVENGAVRVDDTWKYSCPRRVNGKKILVEKEVLVVGWDGSSLSFAIPPGQRVILLGDSKRMLGAQSETASKSPAQDLAPEATEKASGNDETEQLYTEPSMGQAERMEQAPAEPSVEQTAQGEQPPVVSSTEQTEQTEQPIIIQQIEQTEQSIIEPVIGQPEQAERPSVVPSMEQAKQTEHSIVEPVIEQPSGFQDFLSQLNNAAAGNDQLDNKETELENIASQREPTAESDVVHLVGETTLGQDEPHAPMHDQGTDPDAMSLDEPSNPVVPDAPQPATIEIENSNSEQDSLEASPKQTPVTAQTDLDVPDQKIEPDIKPATPSEIADAPIIFSGVTGPAGLARQIHKVDGRTEYNTKLNAWRNFRCLRMNQDMGSLWDLRQSWHCRSSK